ncbi:MAG: hypothetical protein JOS17DRAFT_831728 [Linnemannia elongata]|nr:MAG: hypothetical protein JOS17DRAFT_831728 [Linnemannia elongata]
MTAIEASLHQGSVFSTDLLGLHLDKITILWLSTSRDFVHKNTKRVDIRLGLGTTWDPLRAPPFPILLLYLWIIARPGIIPLAHLKSCDLGLQLLAFALVDQNICGPDIPMNYTFLSSFDVHIMQSHNGIGHLPCDLYLLQCVFYDNLAQWAISRGLRHSHSSLTDAKHRKESGAVHETSAQTNTTSDILELDTLDMFVDLPDID